MSVFLVCMIGVFSLGAFAQKPVPFRVEPGKSPPIERSICGTNDIVWMKDQSDLLKSMGSPIGRYKSEDSGGTSYCTGTLIDKDLFLTAAHCAGNCAGISVEFGYLTQNRVETFRCTEILENGGSELKNDFLILRLEGNPGVGWGWYKVSNEPLQEGQELLMIHHPRATPMKVSQKNCAVVSLTGDMIHHECDTEGGSSGSGILLPDYTNPENTRIVGVHTLGGCGLGAGTNSGPSMQYLVSVSSLLPDYIF